MAIQALITHFQYYLPFNEEEIKIIEDKVTHRKVKRRQMILQECLVCNHYSFMVSGCFRMYGMDDKGYEHNMQFAVEGDWISDIGSFPRVGYACASIKDVNSIAMHLFPAHCRIKSGISPYMPDLVCTWYSAKYYLKGRESV